MRQHDIPDGAVIISPKPTGWCQLVYRLGDYVIKVLHDHVTPEMVEQRMSVAARYSKLCEPFSYDQQSHTIRQRYLGDEPPSPECLEALKQTVKDKKMCITEIKSANVRGGRIIDFQILEPREKRPMTPRKPYF